MKGSPLMSGLMFALLFMLAGTLVASVLLLSTDIPESTWLGTTLGIHATSMFIGGVAAGRVRGSRGWYQGGLLGLLYTIVIWMIGFLAYDAGITREMLIMGAVAPAAGALGGMIGVNIRK